MRSFAIVIRRAYFEAKKRRKYPKNVVVNRSVNIHRIFKGLAKALIRLGIGAGWSEPLLVAHTTLLEISCHLEKKTKQEMSQTRDECPQRNWSSIRHI